MLTKQQQKIVEENHNLIYSFCHKRNLNIDDWYGDLACALCNAVQRYENKGAFSTYVYKCFENAVKCRYRHENTKKRGLNKFSYSLNTTIYNDEKKDISLQDILIDKKTSIENTDDYIFLKQILDFLKNNFNTTDTKIFKLYLERYTVNEISNITQLSIQQIRVIIAEIKSKIRNKFNSY